MNIKDYKIKKILEWRYFGIFESKLKGNGLEVESFRKYQFGDDIKHINWKLSAKSDNTYVNVYRRESDTDIDVLLDLNQNWNSWKDILNKEKVYWYLMDLFEFAWERNWNIKLFHPGSTNSNWKAPKDGLNMTPIWSSREKGYVNLSRIDKILETISSNYQTHIKYFIKRQIQNSKRHIIVVFSDFLDVDSQDIKRLHVLKDKNEVLLFKIDVDKLAWRNFWNFFLKKPKPFPLQTYSI